jgi:Putative amidoligase enzyme
LNTSSRFIAAEIEVAKLNNGIKKVDPTFKNNIKAVEKVVRAHSGSIVHDGSLARGGFEITTSPAAGDVFVKQVKKICKTLASSHAKVDNSCGLHVHVDARDLNYHDMLRLINLYIVIEPILFSMVPKRRRNTHYCKPCAGTYTDAFNKYKNVYGNNLGFRTIKEMVINAIYNDFNSKNRRGHKYTPARYVALNLHSWFYRGTIEFRLFEGSIDPNEIINLGMLWANIIDFIVGTTDDEVRNIIYSVKNKKGALNAMMNMAGKNKQIKSFIADRYKKYASA